MGRGRRVERRRGEKGGGGGRKGRGKGEEEGVGGGGERLMTVMCVGASKDPLVCVN